MAHHRKIETRKKLEAMKVFVLCVQILQDKRLKTIDYKPFLIKAAILVVFILSFVQANDFCGEETYTE